MVEKRFLGWQRGSAALVALALLWCVVMALYSLARLYTLKTSLFDLGAFDQILWLMAQGKAPVTHIFPAGALHWLGFHFSPILYVLVPLYWLCPRPETLLIAQPFLFAVACWPLYRVALHSGLSPLCGASLGAAFLLHPFVLNATLFDFHEIALATPVMAFALLALAARNFRALCIWLMLLLLCKEHYGISVAAFGLLWGILTRQWGRAALLIITGLLAFACVVFVVMPFFAGLAAHPMLEGGMDVLTRYTWLKLPLPQAAAHAVSLLTDFPARLYLLILCVIPLFLPLLAPWLLLPASADLLSNLLSDAIMQRSPLSYHSAAVVPVLIFAVITVSARWKDNRRAQRALLAIPLLSLVCSYIAGPFLLPHSMASWQLGAPVLQPPQEIAQIKALLPGGASLTAQPNIAAFFSQREDIRPFLHSRVETQAVLLRLENPFSPEDFSLYNIPFGQDRKPYREAVRQLLAQPEWGIVYWNEQWLLLMRGEKDRADRAAVKRELF